MKVLSVPVLFSWLLGESQFWQAGILAMGQFGVKVSLLGGVDLKKAVLI